MSTNSAKLKSTIPLELFARISRYTRMVLFGKWALGVVSTVIIIAIIAIPLIEQTRDGKRISFVSGQPQSGAKPVMLNPKLEGVTEKNEPFTATANKAVQESDSVIQLFGVQADMFKADNTWLNMKANEGRYDSSTNTLDLWGEVSLYQDNGYSFATNRVAINTKKASASGKELISGQGPLGNLTATGYAITDNGTHMQFGSTPPERVLVRIQR
jgi:lipopolysaccharide export system protein LptC